MESREVLRLESLYPSIVTGGEPVKQHPVDVEPMILRRCLPGAKFDRTRLIERKGHGKLVPRVDVDGGGSQIHASEIAHHLHASCPSSAEASLVGPWRERTIRS